jgi:hypothetical protein
MVRVRTALQRVLATFAFCGADVICASLSSPRGASEAQSRHEALKSRGLEGRTEELGEALGEELGNVQVATVSKEPEEVWQTPVAIDVLTVITFSRGLRRSPGNR